MDHLYNMLPMGETSDQEVYRRLDDFLNAHSSSAEHLRHLFLYIAEHISTSQGARTFCYRFFSRAKLAEFLVSCDGQRRDHRPEIIMKAVYRIFQKDPGLCLKFDWDFLVKLLNDRKNTDSRWWFLNVLQLIMNKDTNMVQILLNESMEKTVLAEKCQEALPPFPAIGMIRSIQEPATSSTPVTVSESSDGSSAVLNADEEYFSKTYKTELLTGAVLASKPVLVVGPVGCGKSSTVINYAKANGRTPVNGLVVIHLGENMDGKALFGSYRCTEVPGEFIWKPGTFLEAMVSGNWVLIEDVDHAPGDLISYLVSVLETRTVRLAGRRMIVAHPSFQLFGTVRSSGPGSAQWNAETSLLLRKFPICLKLKPLNKSEMRQVAVERCAKLRNLVDCFLNIYSTIVDALAADRVPQNRMISYRDFANWCSRVNTFSFFENAACVFRTAVDCLLAHLRDPIRRMELAMLIGGQLNISRAEVTYQFEKYKPRVESGSRMSVFGQVRIIVSELVSSSKRSVFAFTRPTCALLERIAACVVLSEPVLLVGSTGCGKTTTVQYLAECLGRKLCVINMNQQSELTDLIGGYKPADPRSVFETEKRSFFSLFVKTFSGRMNEGFLTKTKVALSTPNWPVLLQLVQRLSTNIKEDNPLRREWQQLADHISKFRTLVQKCKGGMAFSYIEGILVSAVKSGNWVLLDEINMASSELLNCLYSLFDGASSTDRVVYFEDSKDQQIVMHKNFRLFACMNPGTEEGKRELPVGIRNRFTEFFVDELDNTEDLRILVHAYLQKLSVKPELIDNIVAFYLAVRERCKFLTSGVQNQRPNMSLRTLCRALSCAQQDRFTNPLRSVYEGLCLSFLSDLDSESYNVVQDLIKQFILPKGVTPLVATAGPPSDGNAYNNIRGYWIALGPNCPEIDVNYLVTKQVEKNLDRLCRAASARMFPILIEGETSVGKTSLIQYLAKMTGNVCYRINNHEHTDMQEYVGNYYADASGNLTFVEGPLVKAMRTGAWIILDELNLAEPDILEALNRVLDTNRELFVAETQQTVQAHPNFILFATQNPVGLYSGRKRLSTAFRNRFIELNFEEIPFDELRLILQHRCALPASYASKMVAVMRDLQIHRSTTGLFAGKEGHMTLRDLFRWGERYRRCEQQCLLTDWDRYLAEQGFLLLGGRSRREEDRSVVRETICKCFRCEIDENTLFCTRSPYLDQRFLQFGSTRSELKHVVWTKNLLRMAVLMSQALLYDEPVLLIGETGCGKTTLCQIYAALVRRELFTINCHLSTEAADFVGQLVPAERNRLNDGVLFEWRNGSLVNAMTAGQLLLIDEISLADDSVLERLNSVLEPERQLLLSEKVSNDQDVVFVKAAMGFQLLATMNPGGDYGKKELSKALRNRFTEIWCDATYEEADIKKILVHNLEDRNKLYAELMYEYLTFLSQNNTMHKKFTLSIRDMLSWVDFMNACSSTPLLPFDAYMHGANTIFLDGLGCQSSGDAEEVNRLRRISSEFLKKQLQTCFETVPGINGTTCGTGDVISDETHFGIEPFFITKGRFVGTGASEFNFDATSTKINLFRILRAMQLTKPIMLEGSPGVGKSGIVMAIAAASGHSLTRINLSEQTELSDLFGSDLPVTFSDGSQGFMWRDGPLLSALKGDSWILIDEMNLASQSVLEGLNACFDHRKEIFIPELGKTFRVDAANSRFFACQNPLSQGASRKGLPQSFLNRFSLVYVEELTDSDQRLILGKLYPSIFDTTLCSMIYFVSKLNQEICIKKEWGHDGSPWDFNLRDLMRWCEFVLSVGESYEAFVEPLFAMRMRQARDRDRVRKTFSETCETSIIQPILTWHLSAEYFHIADVFIRRGPYFVNVNCGLDPLILQSSLKYLRALLLSVRLNCLAILVGKGGVGKSFLIYLLSLLCGFRLHVLHATTEMDASELIGSFEQLSDEYFAEAFLEEVIEFCREQIVSFVMRWEMDSVATMLAVLSMAHGDKSPTNVLCAKLMRRLLAMPANAFLDKKNFDNLKKRYQLNLRNSKEVRFCWVDSPLVNAVRQGDWILIENVNLCTSAVLDRLNGLLEKDGVLVVGERGMLGDSIPLYKPHANFRVFFTMSPEYGGISRAMRNRGIEIFIPGEDTWFRNRRDAISVLMHVCTVDMSLAAVLMDFASDLLKTGRMSPADLLRGTFAAKQLEQQRFGPTTSCARAALESVLTDDAEADFSKVSPAADNQLSTMAVSAIQALTNTKLLSFWRDTNFAEDFLATYGAKYGDVVIRFLLFRASVFDYHLRCKFFSRLSAIYRKIHVPPYNMFDWNETCSFQDAVFTQDFISYAPVDFRWLMHTPMIRNQCCHFVLSSTSYLNCRHWLIWFMWVFNVTTVQSDDHCLMKKINEQEERALRLEKGSRYCQGFRESLRRGFRNFFHRLFLDTRELQRQQLRTYNVEFSVSSDDHVQILHSFVRLQLLVDQCFACSFYYTTDEIYRLTIQWKWALKSMSVLGNEFGSFSFLFHNYESPYSGRISKFLVPNRRQYVVFKSAYKILRLQDPFCDAEEVEYFRLQNETVSHFNEVLIRSHMTETNWMIEKLSSLRAALISADRPEAATLKNALTELKTMRQRLAEAPPPVHCVPLHLMFNDIVNLIGQIDSMRRRLCSPSDETSIDAFHREFDRDSLFLQPSFFHRERLNKLHDFADFFSLMVGEASCEAVLFANDSRIKMKRIDLCTMPVVTRLMKNVTGRTRFVSVETCDQLVARLSAVQEFMWTFGAKQCAAKRNVNLIMTHLLSRVWTAIFDVLNDVKNPDSSVAVADWRPEFQHLYQLQVFSPRECHSSDVWTESCLRLGVAVCSLALPGKSPDPVVYAKEKTNLLCQQLERLDAELLVMSKHNELAFGTALTGDESSSIPSGCHPYVLWCSTLARKLRQRLQQRESHTFYRPASSRFEDMKREMSRAFSYIREHTELALKNYKEASAECYNYCISQLQSITDSLIAIAASLPRNYPEYPDIYELFTFGCTLIELSTHLMTRFLVNKRRAASDAAKTTWVSQTPGFLHAFVEILLSSEFVIHSSRSVMRLFAEVDCVRILSCCTVRPCDQPEVVQYLIRLFRSRHPLDDRRYYYYKYEEDSTEETDAAEVDRLFPLNQEADTAGGNSSLSDNMVVDCFDNIFFDYKGDSLCLTDVSDRRSRICDARRYVTLYEIVMRVIAKGDLAINELDATMIEAHLRYVKYAAEVFRGTDRGEESGQSINFYTGSCPKEVLMCREPLLALRDRVGELLQQWADNPSLTQISDEVGRILALPTESPLSTFLEPTASLLGHIDRWEKMAIKSTSLRENLKQICSVYFNWRKLEVAGWENLLNDVDLDYHRQGLTVALHFGALLDECQNGQLQMTDLCQAARDYFSSSSIGQFRARWIGLARILSTLCSRRTEASSVVEIFLSNLLGLHKLFMKPVVEQIERGRQQVEKKLKNYLKIVKFNDTDWWTVVESTKKAHRRLYAFIKEYKKVLATPVEAMLHQGEVVPFVVDVQGINLALDATKVTAPLSVPGNAPSEFLEVVALYPRMAGLLTAVSQSGHYDTCREELDEMRLAISEVRTVLKNRRVLTDITVDGKCDEVHYKKRLVELKNIVRLTVFDQLAKTFSYRRGLQMRPEETETSVFKCDNLVGKNIGSPAETSERISTVRHCDELFWSGYSFRTAFTAARQTVSQQVDAHTLRQCIGFAEVFVSTASQNRKLLSRQLNQVSQLRSVHQYLDSMLKDMRLNGRMCSQTCAVKQLTELQQLATSTRDIVVGRLQLLGCCPSQRCVSDNVINALQLPEVCRWSKDSEKYADTVRRFNDLSSRVTTVVDQVLALVASSHHHTSSYISWDIVNESRRLAEELYHTCVGDLDAFAKAAWMQEGENTFFSERVIVQLCKLYTFCTSNGENGDLDNPMTTEEADRRQQKMRDYSESKACVSLATDLLRNVLLRTQHVYKRSKAIADRPSTVDGLKLSLEALSIPAALDLTEVVKCAAAYRDSFSEIDNGDYDLAVLDNVCTMLSRFLAFVEVAVDRYLHVTAHFLAMNVEFMQCICFLIKEGYLPPLPDRKEDDADRGGKITFENLENAGLGEGSGMNDVSDQIEDFGQIDPMKTDAPPDADESTDVNDVDKPIEMDEDFDGAMDDLHLDENEETENSSEADVNDLDLEERMDEVNEEVDNQIDPGIWNIEEEEEEQQANEVTENQEKTTMKPEEGMVAKDEENRDMTAVDQQETIQKAEDDDSSDRDNEPSAEQEQAESESADDESVEDGGSDAATDDGPPADETTNSPYEGDGESETQPASGGDGDSDTEPDAGPEQAKAEEVPTVGEQPLSADDLPCHSGTAHSAQPEGVDESVAAAGSDSDAMQDERRDVAEDDSREHSQDAFARRRARNVDGSAISERQNRPQGEEPTNTETEGPCNKRAKTDESEKTIGDYTKPALADVDVQTAPTSGKVGSDIQRGVDNTFSHAPNLTDSELQAMDTTSVEVACEQRLPVEQATTLHGRQVQPVAEVVEEMGGKDKQVASHDKDADAMFGIEDEIEFIPFIEEPPVEPIVTDKVGDRTSTIHTVRDVYDKIMDHSLAMISGEFMLHATCPSTSSDFDSRWPRLLQQVEPFASELAENLRIVLTPTTASKLKGDYRTGKRLNIRKLIPYIASHFRKNKIWLRRTKKSSRDYHIMIALDDSSSMQDNNSKQMAYESLALLSAALSRLEVGKLAVSKFGSSPVLLHDLSKSFPPSSGSYVLSQLTFEQKKTNAVELLNFATAYFEENLAQLNTPLSSFELPAQLLLIVSDGRNLFTGGLQAMKAAVQRAFRSNIFVVFIIVDDPNARESILNMSYIDVSPSGDRMQLMRYVDNFPFPFYIFLRNLSALPAIMAEALRQWFTIVTG